MDVYTCIYRTDTYIYNIYIIYIHIYIPCLKISEPPNYFAYNFSEDDPIYINVGQRRPGPISDEHTKFG